MNNRLTYIAETNRRVDSLHGKDDIVQTNCGTTTAEEAALDHGVRL